MTLVSGPSQPYFAVSSCGLVDPACTTGGPFVETEDTAAPLSVFRRNGVVVTLVNVPSPSIIAAATGPGVSTLSGGERLAADLAASKCYVKSHQDPSGTDRQFARILQTSHSGIHRDSPR